MPTFHRAFTAPATRAAWGAFKRVLGAALGLMWMAALSGAAQAAIDQPVATTGGLVQGAPGKTPGFEVFKGIPYAAPPVGDLRWRPPAPAPAWTGLRNADHFAPDCIGLPPSPAPQSTAGASSEDCLYLNVWTPAKAAGEKLPVMVWIYGGGFTGGSASFPQFDGDGLNRKGVILVSMGYRTGVFGFLSHPLLTQESPQHSSGDYGVLDTIAALKWVQANIARFGGDPRRVTVFGQSSGSESVNLVTISPLSKGLFQRVIGESGGSFGERESKRLAAAETAGAAYAQPFGATLAELRAASAQSLLAAAKRGAFEPVVDGWVLPADAHDQFAAGRQNDVPTLVGSNADEAQLSSRTTRDSYLARMHALFGSQADAVVARFPAATDAEAALSMKQIETILLGDFNTFSWASGEAKSGRSSVFQYRFTHAPPAFTQPGGPPGPPSRGAPHGGEVIYVFNNLDTQNRAWTEDDRRLEQILSSYWTNFAKTGDPNGPGLPPWPTVQAAPGEILELGDKVQTIARPNLDTIQFLERVFYGPQGVDR